MEHEDEEDNKRKPLTVGFSPPRRCVLWFSFLSHFSSFWFHILYHKLASLSVAQKPSSDWWTVVIEIAFYYILPCLSVIDASCWASGDGQMRFGFSLSLSFSLSVGVLWRFHPTLFASRTVFRSATNHAVADPRYDLAYGKRSNIPRFGI